MPDRRFILKIGCYYYANRTAEEIMTFPKVGGVYQFIGPKGLGKSYAAQEVSKMVLNTDNICNHPDFFYAAGSMRNALKLLEQSSQAENGISEASVREMLGLTDPVDLFATLDSLIHGSIDRTIPFVRTLLKKGCYPLSMVSDMLSICSDAVVYASTQEMEKKNTAHYRELLGDMCVDVKTSRLCEITNGLMDIYQKLQINADETTLVCGLIAMGGTESARVAKLEERIFQLEQEMKEIRVKGIARHEEAGTPITKNAEMSTTETSEKTEPEDTKIIDENPIEQLNSVSEEETPTESMMDTEANTEFGERVEEETTDSLKETKSSPIDAFDLLGLFGFSHAPQKEEEKKTMEELGLRLQIKIGKWVICMMILPQHRQQE